MSSTARPRRPLLVGGLALLLTGAAVAVWWTRDTAEPTPGARVEPPAPDTAEMSELLRDALEDKRRAVVSAPESGDSWGQLGAILDAHTFYEEALTCYDRASQLAPGDFRWPYLSAVVMDFLGRDIALIETSFRRALALQPDYPPLCYRFAEALIRQGADDRAMASYERAITLDEDFAMAHRGLGQTLLTRGDLERALRHLERAREITPDDSVVHAALARAYHLSADPANSRESTRRARETRPMLSVPDPVRYAVDQLSLDPTSLNRRVAAALTRGDRVSAARDLATLERLFPEDPRHPLRRGHCQRELQQQAAAKQSFERSVALADPTGGAHASLADLLQGQGDLPAALEHRRQAVQLRPDNPRYRNSLGLALAMSGDLDAGLREFETCATLAPPTSEVHHNWGTTLLRSNRIEEATEHFLAALQLQPDSPGTLFNLASIREQQGRTAEAIELYQRAVPGDPSGPAAERLQALGAPTTPR